MANDKARAAHLRRMLKIHLTHPTVHAILERMTDEALLAKYEEHKRISVINKPIELLSTK